MALDFEVYLSEDLDAPSSLFGRVFLGTSGVELAQELIARTISAEASPFESARRVALAEGMKQTIDYFDDLLAAAPPVKAAGAPPRKAS